jgi:hypothetical protein
MCWSRHWTAALLIALLSASMATGQAHDSPAEAVEREVRENIRRQSVGNHALEQFNMPPSFISRVADRIIRSSFEDRYRIVVDDGGGEQTTSAVTAAPTGSAAVLGAEEGAERTRIGLYLTGAVVLASGATTIVLLMRQRKARV